VCRIHGYIGSICSGLTWRIVQQLARRCIGSVGVSDWLVCRIGEGQIGEGRIGEGRIDVSWGSDW
jgi:hypothetical protein